MLGEGINLCGQIDVFMKCDKKAATVKRLLLN